MQGACRGVKTTPRHILVSRYSSPRDEASALAMYRKVASGKTRLGDTIVELTTRCSASAQAELRLLGTSWDDIYICMKKGEIAHYNQKKNQNC